MGQLHGMILWRFKKDGREYRVGFVCDHYSTKVQIGPYNGASNGIWVEEREIEWEPYKR